MVNTGKYKQFLSIPEAAMVWSGLPLELLADAAYPSPGVPLIVGHPDVTARAEALVEATDYGTLMECGRYDPDMPLPPPERRKVARASLLAWIAKHWPDELPSPVRPGQAAAPAADPVVVQLPAPDARAPEQLYTVPQILDRLAISRSQLYRLRDAGYFPEPTHDRPLRWTETALLSYINTPIPPLGRPLHATEPEDI